MIKDIVYFAKVRPDAIVPSKRDEDGGRDLYACFDEEQIIIQPQTSALIPTGIASAFTSDWVAILKERGSTGVKSIKTGAGVIDSGFRNEWQMCMYNGNDKPILITKETNKDTLKILEDDYVVYPYSKAICQILILPVPKLTIKEISYDEILKIPSERNLGMLGSSQK